MPCTNCGHTVQNLGVTGKRVWWCPRCGSIAEEGMEETKTETPLLVERCIALAGHYDRCLAGNSAILDQFMRRIKEAVGRGA